MKNSTNNTVIANIYTALARAVLAVLNVSYQGLSTGSDFTPQETLDNVWRHFCFSKLVGKGQGCC